MGYIHLHFLVWPLFLLLPYLFSFKKAVQFDHLWPNPHDLKNRLSWLLLIGFSYANHLWLAANRPPNIDSGAKLPE